MFPSMYYEGAGNSHSHDDYDQIFGGTFSQVMSPNTQTRPGQPQMGFAITSPSDPRGQALAAQSADKMKRIVFGPLDTSREGVFEDWEFRAKAVIMSDLPDPAEAMDYLNKVNDDKVGDDELRRAMLTKDSTLRLDAMVFSAILECIQGPLSSSILGRIRSSVPFGCGAVAFRLLQKYFQQNGGKRRTTATRELVNLVPGGESPQAYDNFLSRFRVLKMQAGEANAGPELLIDILERSCLRVPILQSVWAAWSAAGIRSPENLLNQIEQTVAASLHSGSWYGSTVPKLAAVAGEFPVMPGQGHWDIHQRITQERLQADAHAAMTAKGSGKGGGKGFSGKGSVKECWKCGSTQHLKADCPKTKSPQVEGSRRGGGAVTMDTLAELLEKILKNQEN